MSKRWLVEVSIHVDAESVREAAQRVYADLWPLYGDRDMEVRGVLPDFSTSRTEAVK